MNKKRVITTIAGVLLFLSIVLTFVWFYPTENSNQTAEITYAEAASKIEKSEIKEAVFKQSQVELTDVKNNKFYAKLESDPKREALITQINGHNKFNTSAPIKYTEERASSSFGWIVWLNALTFFVMWAATLAVIVYAVKTLSRNKS